LLFTPGMFLRRIGGNLQLNLKTQHYSFNYSRVFIWKDGNW